MRSAYETRNELSGKSDREIVKEAKALLKCQCRNQNDTRLFLYALKFATRPSLEEKMDCLSLKDAYGNTLGWWIAHSQEAITVQQFLSLLKKWLKKSEGRLAQKIGDLLSIQCQENRTLCMIVAWKQNPEINQQFLMLYKELSVRGASLQKIGSTPDIYGWALDSFIKVYQNTNYLQFLEIFKGSNNNVAQDVGVEKIKELEERMLEQESTITDLEKRVLEQGSKIKELSLVQNVNPKLLDHLLEGKKIDELKQLLKEPNKYDLRGLCLIPFTDNFENINVLKQKGAIVSWEELKNVLNDLPENAPRSYFKRLYKGVYQLKQIWQEEGLQNKEAQAELDKESLCALAKAYRENKQPYPEIQHKLEAIKEIEIEKWFPPIKWDRYLCERVVEKLNKNENSLLYRVFTRELQLLLAQQFLDGKLPQEVLLNELDLSRLICERIETSNNRDSQALFMQERDQVKGKNNNALTEKFSILQEKTAKQLALKWLNREVIGKDLLTLINEIAGELLLPLCHENLDIDLKVRAVEFLLEQLKNNSLGPLAKHSFIEQIKSIFLEEPYTNEQIESALKEILEAFKRNTLKDGKLILICSGFLIRSLTMLEERLRFPFSEKSFLFFRSEENPENKLTFVSSHQN